MFEDAGFQSFNQDQLPMQLELRSWVRLRRTLCVLAWPGLAALLLQEAAAEKTNLHEADLLSKWPPN